MAEDAKEKDQLAPCKECGYRQVHALRCTSQTREEQLAMALSIIEANQRESSRRSSLLVRERERQLYWQGKTAMLKHENNILRRRLYARDGATVKWTKGKYSKSECSIVEEEDK